MNYIFDLDGTLVDSSEDILDALNGAYKYMGLTKDIPKCIIGGKIHEIIRKLSPEADDMTMMMLISQFRERYDRCFHKKTKLYPGVKEVLEKIKGSCYLVTNKPEKVATDILNIFRLEFVDERFGTKGMDKSDLIKDIIHENKLKDCLYVGDTTEDIDSAHKAGLKCAVVIYGFGNNIKNYKADYFLEKFEEVLYAYIKT